MLPIDLLAALSLLIFEIQYELMMITRLPLLSLIIFLTLLFYVIRTIVRAFAEERRKERAERIQRLCSRFSNKDQLKYWQQHYRVHSRAPLTKSDGRHPFHLGQCNLHDCQHTKRRAQMAMLCRSFLNFVAYAYQGWWTFNYKIWQEVFNVIGHHVDYMWQVRAPLVMLQLQELKDTRQDRIKWMQPLLNEVEQHKAEISRLSEEILVLREENPEKWQYALEWKERCDKVGLFPKQRGWTLFIEFLIWSTPCPHWRKVVVQYALSALVILLGCITLLRWLGVLWSIGATVAIFLLGLLELQKVDLPKMYFPKVDLSKVSIAEGLKYLFRPQERASQEST